ncbi:sensor histidine kinase [Flavobacterium sp. RHBU_3]|uniref:sensor histidine kinase n=1 Tax=Flavobacterium sp. RHBU_3 TaxID=3391184 RepID=UPI003985218D
MEKYRISTGAIISLFIGLLAFLPVVAMEREFTTTIIVVNAATIFLYSICCWMFNMFLITSGNLPKMLDNNWLKIIISFIVAFIASYLLLYKVRDQFGPDTLFSLRQAFRSRPLVSATLFRGSFVNAFLYFLGYILHLNTQNQLALIENEKLKHENLEARLFVLRQQLSPHFLFNSLGILNTLTTDAAVQKYIIQLSHIYRYLLAGHESHLSLLRKEIEFINAYLYIIQERFENGLQVKLDVNPGLFDKQLPPAALQLLIENAIKHNVVSESQPLEVHIYTEDGYIVVANTLNRKLYDAPEEGGTGLYNIAERYRLLSGRNIIIEQTHTHFTVKLPLI